MTKFHHKAIVRRNPVAAILFYIVCLLLFPATLVGYVLWVVKLYTGRSSGVSATAQGPLSARWFQHQLGTRHDEVANQLLMVLPGVSPLAVRLVFGPLLLAHRLTSYVPKAFRYPFDGKVSLRNQASARQTFYDSAVDQYLPKVAQFVILGAGFDTRTFRLPKGMQVQSFEVDTPKTLALKQAVLKQAGVDVVGVTFVPADFEHDDWLKRMVEAGFDANKPTFFLWEGVTPYLDRAAVEDILRKVASTAQGSIIAFDYFTTEVLESQSLYLRAVRASLQAGGEPLKFGLDSTPPLRKHLDELLGSCGLALLEQHTVGKESAGGRAWGGFAIAQVR
jgi:methyltransferase (TIGR00027 family)